MEKRVRSQNFTMEEKIRLLDIVTEKKAIIENKKTDAVSILQKKEAWKEVETIFNSQGSIKRSQAQLKICYDNIKHDSKKRHFEEKREQYKTGGGPMYSQRDDPLHHRAMQLLGSSVNPLPNKNDSGAAYHHVDEIHLDDIVTMSPSSEKSAEIEWIEDEQPIASLGHEYIPQATNDPPPSPPKKRFTKNKPVLKSVYSTLEKITDSKLQKNTEAASFHEHIKNLKTEENKIQMEILKEELKYAQLRNKKVLQEIKNVELEGEILQHRLYEAQQRIQ